MNILSAKNWSSGSGKDQKFEKILEQVSSHSKKNQKIFIGSDSFVSRQKVCFVTAVCLVSYGRGSRYFFYKESAPAKRYNILSTRITEEVRRSIELAEIFMSEAKMMPEMIELHLDVSPFAAKESTSKFSEMLKGYVQGYGFGCKLKPNAWASQSVADRHSK
tara:strand:+ start:2035 stop:2520 length:486 start_codon:yes stop_codon:yes gene_type:complete